MSRRIERGRERERDTSDRYDKREASYGSMRGEKRRRDDSGSRHRESGVRVKDDRTDKYSDFHTLQYENAEIDYDKRSFVTHSRGRGRGRGSRGRGRGMGRFRGSYGPLQKVPKFNLSHEAKSEVQLESKVQASLTEMENKLSKSQELFQEKLLTALQGQKGATAPEKPTVSATPVKTVSEVVQESNKGQEDGLKKKKKREDPTMGKLQIRVANGKPLMMPFQDVPISKHDQKMKVNWSREGGFGVSGKWINPLNKHGKMKCNWILPDGINKSDYDVPALKEFLCKVAINRSSKEACFINIVKFIDNIDGASPSTVWFNDANPDALTNIAGNTRITGVYFKHSLDGLAGAFFLKGHCKDAGALQHLYYHSNYATVCFSAINEITWVLPSPANLIAHLTDLMTNSEVEISGSTAALTAQVSASPKGTYGVWDKDRKLPYIYNQTQPAIHLSCLGDTHKHQPMKWQIERMKELPVPKSMFIFSMGGRPWIHAKKEYAGHTTFSEINKCIDPKVFQLCLGIEQHSMAPNHLQWTIRNIFYQSSVLIDSRSSEVHDSLTIDKVIAMMNGTWTKLDFFHSQAAELTEEQTMNSSPPANSSDLEEKIEVARRRWEQELQSNFLALMDGQQVASKDDLKSL